MNTAPIITRPDKLRPSRFESNVADATPRQLVMSRAAMLAVAREWQVQVDDFYADRRHPMQRQARSALALMLYEELDFTRLQLMQFTGRRSQTRAWQMMNLARQLRRDDKLFGARWQRAVQMLDNARSATPQPEASP